MKTLKLKLKGKITFNQIQEQKQLSYYCFTPAITKDVLVLVHGISRNAEELIESFAPIAENNNITLIAPIFSKEYAADYQRLGRLGKGPRSDYLLLSVLNNYKQLYKKEFNRFHLFGYSAGAQFAHRFAFAHPNLVKKVALSAAGWYSLPTTSLPYPRGTKIDKQFTDIIFEPQRYLRTKFRVYIGSEDNKRDVSLNKSSKIDLTQGKNRISRAENWIESMQSSMLKHSIDNSIKLGLLEGAGHSFKDCVENSQLHDLVMTWINTEKD